MEDSSKTHGKPDARFHLANERTLLAWVRTGIALMAFGFVVVKFSLFLKQVELLSEGKIQLPQKGNSSILGISLVIIGAVLILLAYVKFKRTENQLLADSYKPTSGLVLTLTLLLLVTSLLLVLYLVNNS
jgi:putative membrane protein